MAKQELEIGQNEFSLFKSANSAGYKPNFCENIDFLCFIYKQFSYDFFANFTLNLVMDNTSVLSNTTTNTTLVNSPSQISTMIALVLVLLELIPLSVMPLVATVNFYLIYRCSLFHRNLKVTTIFYRMHLCTLGEAFENFEICAQIFRFRKDYLHGLKIYWVF